MSKQRAARRAAREAEEAKLRAKRARQVARRARGRALRTAVDPRRAYRRVVPDRRTGRLGRRSSGERFVITTMTVIALAAVWFLIDSLALRIAFTLLAVVAVPVAVVVAFDRRA
jgi:Flp pilus assembly protein TadB